MNKVREAMITNSKSITIALALVMATQVFAQVDQAQPDHVDFGIWTTTWATANRTITALDAPLPGINNATLRQVVRISQGGRKIRVSFTNEFGTNRSPSTKHMLQNEITVLQVSTALVNNSLLLAQQPFQFPPVNAGNLTLLIWLF